MAQKTERTEDLTQEEMVEILKAIARDGSNAAARIAAIRQLREMEAGKPASDGFADLDAPAPVRQLRTKTG